MKLRVLAALSAICLVAAIPASSQTSRSPVINHDQTMARQEGETIPESSVADGKVSFTLFSDTDDSTGWISTIDERMTAKGMLGKPLMNSGGEQIATIADIILDEKGFAKIIVVSDVTLINLSAKELSFDYEKIVTHEKKGDLISPLTQEMVTGAQRFSYDQEDAARIGARVMPAGAYSIKRLLSANVTDPEQRNLARVDNISFKNGRARNLIINFGKDKDGNDNKMGLTFSDIILIPDGNSSYNFHLTPDQMIQFETFKKSLLD